MKVLCLVGPTGTGKSRVGVQLAKRLNAEIVNADSRQVYVELQIGASKPPLEEREGVPHHLFNEASLKEPWDTAQFMERARQLVGEIHARGRLPLVVGGTGLYVKALLFGLFSGPKADSEIRRELKEKAKANGIQALHEELRAVDLEAARRIHPNDSLRIIRALEVYRLMRRPISEVQAEHRFQTPAYDYLKIGLTVERAILYRNIDLRVETMIKRGLEEEVRGLYELFGEHPLILRSIGYKEWLPYFKGEIPMEAVIREIQQNTRRFAKRQMTWFRKEEDVQWHVNGDLEGIVGSVKSFLGGG